jgi:hypothetical protein
MPLGDPPPAATLSQLPKVALSGKVLHRMFSVRRTSPWWFASLISGQDPDTAGRFDLPVPWGSCYLATTKVAAALEPMQHFSLIPVAELVNRRIATVTVPPGSPAAAGLGSPRARGIGVTAELWAGRDRPRTQSWALALVQAGWRALHHGVSHDPSGRLRGVTLFDAAGDHPPFGDTRWVPVISGAGDDAELRAGLERYGIEITVEASLPVIDLKSSGLLET